MLLITSIKTGHALSNFYISFDKRLYSCNMEEDFKAVS